MESPNSMYVYITLGYVDEAKQQETVTTMRDIYKHDVDSAWMQ